MFNLKKSLFLVILVIGFIFFPKNVLATSYYVSLTGSDTNPGTLASPWKTIQKAANTIVGGDTVYIRSGVYSERVSLEYKGNSTGPYKTFIAYPGETPVIDGTGIDILYGGGLFHIWKSDYIRVSGIKVQNSNGAGIYVAYSNNIQVDNNRTYNTVKSGVSTWGSSNVIVDKNDIALACNSHPNYPASEENISIDNSTNVEVKNNYVHQAANIPDGYSGGEGINIKDGSSYVKVHDNVVHLDERTDGKLSNRLAFGLDAWNNTANTKEIEFFNNIAYNSYYGFIVSSEQGGVVENVKLYNNIAYNNNRAGFSIVWWSGTVDAMKRNVQFINNTSYNNEYGFSIQSPQNENIIVRNNIFSQNKVAPIFMVSQAIVQTTIDHNLFFGTGGTYGSNFVVGDPKFVNPSTSDFRLQAGSPAINSGDSLNAPLIDFIGATRPQGGVFDIGAYEYAGLVNPTPTVKPTATSVPTLVPTPTAVPVKPGDADGNGTVDELDYQIWLCHYLNQASCSFNADFNSDGSVNGIDYTILVNNFTI